MHLLAALLYFSIAAGILAVEINGLRKRGADAFHVVLFFYGLYILFPSTIIHALLFFNPHEETGIYFFDSVLRRMDAIQSAIVLHLNVIFLLGLYLVRIYSINATRRLMASHVVRLRPRVTALWLFFGAAVCGTFFLGLGENFGERYARLILFRLQDVSSDRDFFTANAFAITQTFAWLCAGLTFVAYKLKRYSLALALGAATLMFAFLMGSRRGFLFPIIIGYLCAAMYSGKFGNKKMAMLLPLALLWLAYGKELTSLISADQEELGVVSGIYQSASSAVLRAFADIGAGQICSFGVLQHFEPAPRLGVDHLLSFLRRIPAKDFIGLSRDIFPERITRTTTAAFVSANDDDIPPGLMGASWLDFPFLGAFIWGLALGGQALLVEFFRRKVVLSALSVMLVTLTMIIVAMPVNTGTYDFTVSVDIVLLSVILLTSIRLISVRSFIGANRSDAIRGAAEVGPDLKLPLGTDSSISKSSQGITRQ